MADQRQKKDSGGPRDPDSILDLFQTLQATKKKDSPQGQGSDDLPIVEVKSSFGIFAERRVQLLTAALILFGGIGWAGYSLFVQVSQVTLPETAIHTTTAQKLQSKTTAASSPGNATKKEATPPVTKQSPTAARAMHSVPVLRRPSSRVRPAAPPPNRSAEPSRPQDLRSAGDSPDDRERDRERDRDLDRDYDRDRELADYGDSRDDPQKPRNKLRRKTRSPSGDSESYDGYYDDPDQAPDSGYYDGEDYEDRP